MILFGKIALGVVGTAVAGVGLLGSSAGAERHDIAIADPQASAKESRFSI